jgi:hypothetical protein
MKAIGYMFLGFVLAYLILTPNPMGTSSSIAEELLEEVIVNTSCVEVVTSKYSEMHIKINEDNTVSPVALARRGEERLALKGHHWITATSDANIRKGIEVGEVASEYYGSFSMKVNYLNEKVVDENNVILGDNKFSFIVNIAEVNDYYELDKVITDNLGTAYSYPRLTVNLADVIFTECNIADEQQLS